jgi:hypothetical protein
MKHWIPASLAVALTVTAAGASDVHPKHRHHHDYHGAYAAPYPAGPPMAQPAHMIEVRPGLWISSYDCVTDEGQGRWFPCDMGGGRR